MVELDSVRRNWFRPRPRGISPGICAIGKAARVKGQPLAAVSAAVPSPRFDQPLEEAVIACVLQTARELENLAR